MSKFYKSKMWMMYRWTIQKKSVEEMAKEANCSIETINYYLNYHGLRESRSK